jgi:hypothetical protein
MSIEMLTYAALGVRLKVSPEAARALANRLRLPRSRSQDGKVVVSVDLAEIRHTPRSPGFHHKGTSALEAKIETLQAEIARLEAGAVSQRADFERERDRADRLMAELLKAMAGTVAAKERLEGELAALRAVGPVAGQPQAVSRVRHLAAALVEADRRACK